MYVLVFNYVLASLLAWTQHACAGASVRTTTKNMTNRTVECRRGLFDNRRRGGGRRKRTKRNIICSLPQIPLDSHTIYQSAFQWNIAARYSMQHV